MYYFFGFPQNTKGYIILNLKFNSIEISRDVIFHENHFPYKLDSCLPKDPNTLSLPISNAYNSAFDLFSDTAPPAEPCASTPAPNNVPTPASLSSDLPANSASTPASNTAPPPALSLLAPPGSTSPQFQEISSSSPTTCLSCRFPHCNQHCKSYILFIITCLTIPYLPILEILFSLSTLILKLGPITKPQNMLLGNLPCKMSFKLLLLIILSNLPLSLQERKLLVVNGYIKSNTILMALLSTTKLELLPKGSPNLKDLIS